MFQELLVVVLALSTNLCQINAIYLAEDPCLSSPCQAREICKRLPDLKNFLCISEPPPKVFQIEKVLPVNATEESIQTNLTSYPENFYKSYLEFDPCLSSPCKFGKICHNIPVDPGYECVLEGDRSPQAAKARNIYKIIERVYGEAINSNINNLAKGKQVSSLVKLKASKKTTNTNLCSPSPCESGFDCILSDEAQEGFICAQTNINKPNLSRKDIATLCKGDRQSERIPYPNASNKFIFCITESNYVVMMCPTGLLFNNNTSRCEHTLDPVKSVCDLAPCKYGGKCVEDNKGGFQCICPPNYQGKTCEIAPDFCSNNPCGDNGVCNTMPAFSPIPFYCTCSNEARFGRACDETAELNPCLDDTQESTIFPTKISPSLFVHCQDERINLKFCPTPLVYSHEHGQCEWGAQSLRSQSR